MKTIKTFYPDGTLYKVSESSRNRNKLTEYYISGCKKIIEYTVDNKLHNEEFEPAVIRYDVNNNVILKAYFSNGRPVENGVPSYVIYYHNGSIDTEVYHHNGKISRVVLFRRTGEIESCLIEDKLEKHLNACKKIHGQDLYAYREY